MYTSKDGWRFSTGQTGRGYVEGPLYFTEYHTALFEQDFPLEHPRLANGKMTGNIRYPANQMETIVLAHQGWNEPNWKMLSKWALHYYEQTELIGAPDKDFWKVRVVFPNQMAVTASSWVEDPLPQANPAIHWYLTVFGNKRKPCFVLRQPLLSSLDQILERMREGQHMDALAYRSDQTVQWSVIDHI